MLPPFIIEQIRKREEEEQREREEQRPHLEIPLPLPSERPRKPPVPDDEMDRGVVIIEL